MAYSVGNFAFGSLSSSTTQSGILFLTYDKNKRWSGGWVVPLDVNNYRVNFCPTPMKEAAAVKFFAYLKALSKNAVLSLDGSIIHWQASAVPSQPAKAQKIQDNLGNPNGSLPGNAGP